MSCRTALLRAIGVLGVAGVLTACTTSTPTSTDGGPTETPEGPPPTSTVESPPTWQTVERTPAAAAGRSDCPEGWLAYVDPQHRFSICYPTDSRVTAGEPALNIRGPNEASQSQDGFTVIISWSDTPIPAGVGGASAETCADFEYGMETVSSRFVELTLDNQEVPACLWQGTVTDMDPPLPVGSMQGSISDAGGFVNFQVDFGGPSVPEVPFGAQAILDSLVVATTG
jgi:hypothetical protein